MPHQDFFTANFMMLCVLLLLVEVYKNIINARNSGFNTANQEFKNFPTILPIYFQVSSFTLPGLFVISSRYLMVTISRFSRLFSGIPSFFSLFPASLFLPLTAISNFLTISAFTGFVLCSVRLRQVFYNFSGAGANREQSSRKNTSSAAENFNHISETNIYFYHFQTYGKPLR